MCICSYILCNVLPRVGEEVQKEPRFLRGDLQETQEEETQEVNRDLSIA